MYVDPAVRGKAVAPTALAQLADKVLLSTRAHRLETEILATNKAAKKWLKHEGFTQESFKKHSWWKDGSPRSTVVLRLLTPDWRRIKGGRHKPAQEVA
jgi:RimJ/RimL family protein N-acetyltransferase